jgi:flagellar biogenesis protein FliO
LVASPLPFPSPSTGPLFATPPPAFQPPPEISVWPYLVQLAIFTLILGGGAYFVLRLLRDKMPGLLPSLGLSSASGLKIVDRVQVDTKRMVFVVALGKRSWLVAATDHAVTTVAELDPEDLGSAFEAIVEKETNRGR